MQHNYLDQKNEETRLKEQRQLAEVIRQACLQAALAGYEDASISGLCHEGAWECAIDAIRSLDINTVLEQALPDSKDEARQEPG
jgi:hypothetical protein